MKARMKGDLFRRYNEALPHELDLVLKYHGESEYNHRVQFLESIQGKVVNLVFISDDAFEENDNNYWLPNSLWNKIN